MNDVVIVTFDELARAQTAMDALRRLHEDEVVEVRSAAIVVREADGRFSIPEDEEHVGWAGVATGGAIGALLGALVGPIGALLWGAAGALLGSVVDAEDAEVSEDVLTRVVRDVAPGTTALVADIQERAPSIVDTAMTAAGGTVHRRLRADVEEELLAAEEAVVAARREAARVLRERRKAAGEATLGDRVGERVDDLKEKIRR